MTGNGAGAATRAAVTPPPWSAWSAFSAASGSSNTATRSSCRTGHLGGPRRVTGRRRAGRMLSLHGLGDRHGWQDLDEEEKERQEHAEASEADAHLEHRRRVVVPDVGIVVVGQRADDEHDALEPHPDGD